MSGIFLYFFPGVNRDELTRDIVAATWLADVWPEELRSDDKFRRVTKHFVQAGPSGSSGIIACCAAPTHHSDQPIGYYPDRQTWQQVGQHWLGFDNVERPTPESLAREKMTSGLDVVLGDKNAWHAPIIRKTAENGSVGCNLPMKVGINPAGEYTETLRGDVVWAWDMACELWNARYSTNEMTKGRFLEIITKLLGINYRLGSHEAFALDLFDTHNMVALTMAYLDIAALEEWVNAQDLKKNLPAAGQ